MLCGWPAEVIRGNRVRPLAADGKLPTRCKRYGREVARRKSVEPIWSGAGPIEWNRFTIGRCGEALDRQRNGHGKRPSKTVGTLWCNIRAIVDTKLVVAGCERQ